MSLHVVLLPPRAADLQTLQIATGVRAVWRCALFAAGAQVDAPGFGWRAADVPRAILIPLRLRRTVASPWDAWELCSGLVFDRGNAEPAYGTVRRGSLAQVTSVALLDLSEQLGLRVPDNLRWPELFRTQTHGVVEGLRTLGTAACPGLAA